MQADRTMEGDREGARKELGEARQWLDEARRQLDRQAEQVCLSLLRARIPPTPEAPLLSLVHWRDHTLSFTCSSLLQVVAANARSDALDTHNKALQYKVDALEALASDRQSQCLTLEQAAARAASERADAEARARKLGQELATWQRRDDEVP